MKKTSCAGKSQSVVTMQVCSGVFVLSPSEQDRTTATNIKTTFLNKATRPKRRPLTTLLKCVYTSALGRGCFITFPSESVLDTTFLLTAVSDNAQ